MNHRIHPREGGALRIGVFFFAVLMLYGFFVLTASASERVSRSPYSIERLDQTVQSTPSPTFQRQFSPTVRPRSKSSVSDGPYLSFLPFLVIATDPHMISIPQGTFLMGCDSTIDICGGSYYNGYLMETPLHTVNLSAYAIDRYAVTNAEYAGCVATGVCYAPANFGSGLIANYYGNPTYDKYPVLHVNWYMAQTYCLWIGERLPTEAEWEKAARGSTDTRRYPWGNADPDCTMANVRLQSGMCVGDTTPVGSYAVDVSPSGVREMSGNVWNWVSDWYQEDYYFYSPYSNPQGPSGPTYSSGDNCDDCKVVRGGSWWFAWRYARTSYRGRTSPWTHANWLGIRCARSL